MTDEEKQRLAFQSTLPRRERLQSPPARVVVLLFQSTLPRRERRYNMMAPLCGRDFNPRSREGSDVAPPVRSAVLQPISIHAPAKGATSFDQPAHLAKQISIHAPAKGATGEEEEAEVPPGISIHAPAKGATMTAFYLLSLWTEFQSTLPRRERHKRNQLPPTNYAFQSTLPRRERRC